MSWRDVKSGNDLVEKLLANRPRLARAHGGKVATNQVCATVRLKVIPALFCPRREFPGLGVF